MKKQQLQQKLRELITKHNPSLKKLRLGTEVIITDEDYKGERESAYFIGINDEDDGNIWADVIVRRPDIFGGLRNVVLEGMYINKIIGHPIELRHLLIALEKSCDPTTTNFVFRFDTDYKEPCSLFKRKNGVETEIIIDLSIPLLDNEEKVLQDLIDILS